MGTDLLCNWAIKLCIKVFLKNTFVTTELESLRMHTYRPPGYPGCASQLYVTWFTLLSFLMAATWLRVSMLFWIHEKTLRNHVHYIFLCAWLSKLQGLILFPLLGFELNNITTIATMCCFINMNIVTLLCYFVGWKLWNTTAVFVLCFRILLWLHQSAISRWDILRLLSCNPFYGVGVICTWWSTPVC